MYGRSAPLQRVPATTGPCTVELKLSEREQELAARRIRGRHRPQADNGNAGPRTDWIALFAHMGARGIRGGTATLRTKGGIQPSPCRKKEDWCSRQRLGGGRRGCSSAAVQRERGCSRQLPAEGLEGDAARAASKRGGVAAVLPRPGGDAAAPMQEEGNAAGILPWSQAKEAHLYAEDYVSSVGPTDELAHVAHGITLLVVMNSLLSQWKVGEPSQESSEEASEGPLPSTSDEPLGGTCWIPLEPWDPDQTQNSCYGTK